MPSPRPTLAVAALVALAVALPAAREGVQGALARMPIKEVSIFKDGHAFVMHEGTMPIDASGRVVMDYLPAPVLGTFWAYAADPAIKVAAATAGQHLVTVARTALELDELLRANTGAEVTITEKPSGAARDLAPYDATILGLPRRTTEELLPTSPPNTPESLPQNGRIILLRTPGGVKALPIDRIQDVVFKAAPNPKVAQDEFRNVLTLTLAGRPAARTAPVGIVYVQKGLRWIPGYRVSIDGHGTATLQLQAQIVNELADLDDVAANLVVGVPSFAFRDTLDPLAAPAAVPLSSYFVGGTRGALSNAIASQVAFRPGEAGTPPSPPAVPEFGSASQAEDLFLYSLRNVSLRKGERLSVPVVERTLAYTDLYTLDLPFAPPPEVHATMSGDAQGEVARALVAPQAVHKIRLANAGSAPLTTAPALVVQAGRVLSQGLMSYTPAGGSGDLEIGKAVDVQVVRSETESARTPNATRVNGDTYSDVRISGTIALTNFRKDAIDLEVTRSVLGRPIAATLGGRVERLSVLASYPEWWRYYAWPSWWWLANGQGRITWTLHLEPGQRVELSYEWGYYWR